MHYKFISIISIIISISLPVHNPGILRYFIDFINCLFFITGTEDWYVLLA